MIPDKCVGCGLCQTRCYGINVLEKGVLDASAIVIKAGTAHEDRLMNGSYQELRKTESVKSDDSVADGSYLPDFLIP